jgi:hypothetical protein
MEKGRYDKNASHPHLMTLQIGHQLRFRSYRRRGETIIKWETMRRNSLEIWKNIGQIVILLYQIVHEQVKWTLRSLRRVKRISPKNEVNNKVFDELSKLNKKKIIERYKKEEQESIERSHLMVELCEQPFYDIKPE